MITLPIDEATARAIYDVLVEECGASPDVFDRGEFVGERLGHQGRFWCSFRLATGRPSWGFYRDDEANWLVSANRVRDETPERLAMIAAANARLAELRARWVAQQVGGEANPCSK